MAFRTLSAALLLLAAPALTPAADRNELKARRERAAEAFHDGILMIHARTTFDMAADSFRQDPVFFYFTGLENIAGAILAIDGRSRESWLFLPTRAPYSTGSPDWSPEAVARAGIEHVSDWSELESFMTRSSGSPAALYYLAPPEAMEELPLTLAAVKPPRASYAPRTPLWVVALTQRWPSFEPKEVRTAVYGLLDVQSPQEMASVRAAATATVAAWMAGMHAIQPGVSQQSVEAVVEDRCWKAGAHGSAFWAWAMAGANGVFPGPFRSLARYDHLNAVMQAGDLVRLDIGCESDHYGGDLGRTVPVSGRYTAEQREIWNSFVAAYQAGVRTIREGVTADQVFEAWSAELVRHRALVKTDLARQAIDEWSKREKVPYWQIHTMNLVTGPAPRPLRAGTTVAFEPIASIGGQGYYLEDMYVVTATGAQLLTPGVPYTAEEIEAAMRRR